MKYLNENGLLYLVQKIKTWLGGKVDKVDGKSLSTNDYTTEEKNKLASLENYSLPTASAETLGGVKVGAGLAINNGVLSATGGGTADSVDWSNVQNQPVGSLTDLKTTDKTSVVNAINEVYGGTSVVISDTDEDTVIKTKLLSTVDSNYNIIKPAFLISDGMMIFTLADVDTEDGKKQFRFKAGNLINMEGQNMSYSVEILYRISSTGELEKDYATGMFLDNEATIEVINQTVADAIGDVQGIEYSIVTELPTTGKAGVIYLINNNGSNPNIYDEYVWITDKFEKIGTTETDLSNYYTKSEMKAITNGEIDTICAS